MYKLFQTMLAVSAFVTLLLTASCSDDKDETPVAPAGKIIAKIDGASFEGDAAAQIQNDEIIVAGLNGDESISIIITKAAEVGTYDLKGAPVGVTPDAEINYTPDGGVHFFSTVFADNGVKVGSVTVTEIDETNKTVSGTFECKPVASGGGTAEIVSGSFTKIPYAEVADGRLSAKVDGVTFTASIALAVNGMGEIVVNGQSINGSKIITLSFDEDITAGTYDIGELGSDVYGTYTVSPDIFVSSEGTLTITSHNKTTRRVEGTFSFEAVDFMEELPGHTITQGTFAVTYP